MRRSHLYLAALIVSCLVLVGCPAGSPEEQVAAKRALYTVELNSWYAEAESEPVDETVEIPVEGEEAAAEDDAGQVMDVDEADEPNAADEIAAEDEGEGPDVTVAAGPELHTIVFDLLVLYDGRDEPLPGLTVEVTHAGADGQEKGSWLQYLEMPNIAKGVSKQVGFQREGVVFEEGDVFAVNVNKNVPADLRSEYREFQTAGN